MIKQCTKCQNYDISITDAPCRECQTAYHLTRHKPNFKSTLTNADRIRAMDDEELSVWISALYTAQYNIQADPNFWLDWLQKEVGQ